MFEPGSRYGSLQNATLVVKNADGTQRTLTFKERRILPTISAEIGPSDLITQHTVDDVTVPEPVSRWIVELLEATRRHPRVRLGASTRGGLAVAGLARAMAVMRGRAFVVPDDVAAVAVPAPNSSKRAAILKMPRSLPVSLPRPVPPGFPADRFFKCPPATCVQVMRRRYDSLLSQIEPAKTTAKHGRATAVPRQPRPRIKQV